MPKTVKHICPAVATFANLAHAFQKVRVGKRFDSDTLLFYSKLEENLFQIEEALQQKTWAPHPFRQFTVTKPKTRLIQAPEFADRVVHQAVILQAGPAMARRFIADSYASIPGRGGTHAASRRLKDFLRVASRTWEQPYIIKADIKSYFASIPHNALMQRIKRVFFRPRLIVVL